MWKFTLKKSSKNNFKMLEHFFHLAKFKEDYSSKFHIIMLSNHSNSLLEEKSEVPHEHRFIIAKTGKIEPWRVVSREA